MVSRDVVLAKISQIDRAIQRIADIRSRRDRLTPADVDELLALNLQRATQASIDLAAHVIATQNYEVPDSLAASFTILAQHDVVDRDLAERLRRMAGFRNVAVHQYEDIDRTIVDAIVSNHLGDLTEFGRRIVERFLS